MSAPIAILVAGNKVLCLSCARDQTATGSLLYPVNIYPYRQDCHKCKATVVHGRTEAWCQLFPAEPLPPLEDI